MLPEVSIVIASFNKKELLKQALESIFEQSFKNIEVIVIDNASTDGTSNMIKEKFPRVKLIQNNSNLLFCKAYNQGIQKSITDFILIMNNDIELDKDFIKNGLEVFKIDSKIGMVSGKIVSQDGERIDSCGQVFTRERRPLERGYKQKNLSQYNKSEFIFGPCGSCAFYKKDMLEDVACGIEYFDENFEILYEDFDLNWRANRKGWKGYYAPEAVAYHIRGASTIQKRGRRRSGIFNDYMFPYLKKDLKIHLLKNRYLTLLKNESFKGLTFNLLYIIMYDLKLWSYILVFEPSLIYRFFKVLKFIKPTLRKRKLLYSG